MGLLALPSQPSGIAWPTREWPERSDAAKQLAPLVEAMFSDHDRFATTYALVVVHHGSIIAERYSGALPNWSGTEVNVTRSTPLLSWSMAKSMTHAAIGILVGRGLLDLDAAPAVLEWAEDERSAITLNQLLQMRDGLDFVEDYLADTQSGGVSDVIEMLFGEGATDVAKYAIDRPLRHVPGSVFNYSSGTSNIVARIAGDALGGGEHAIKAFLRDELFEAIGMRSAKPRFDEAGTFVGSSYVYATARDHARFGLLYLRDGVWDGCRILPTGWVDHARTLRSVDPQNGRGYGAHWWVVNDEFGSFWASGYEGQMIVCVPALDLLIVRLGRTDASLAPNLYQWRADVTDLFSK